MDGAPLDGGPPLASFLLFSYNQEAYIEAAMRSALAQTYQPLEIIVSDDASSDGTFAVIERIHAEYDGPHTLRINRNPVNLGMGGHYDHVMRMAKGQVIVLAAGDDVSLPQRTQRVVGAFAASPSVGLVYSDMGIIDGGGSYLRKFVHLWDVEGINAIDNYLHHQATMFGASFAISRALLDAFGPIEAWNEIEDKVLIFRCLVAGYRIAKIDEELMLWREVGRSSSTRKAYRSPLKTEMQDHVPGEVAGRWLTQIYRQNLLDLKSLGKAAPEIEGPLKRNLAEARLAHALWVSDAPSAGLLWAAISAGARARTAAKLFLKFRFMETFLRRARKQRGAAQEA